MSKKMLLQCPTCGKTITKTKKGTYVSECDCDPLIIPDDTEINTGRHIEVNFSDSTKTKEKFGG